MQDIEVYIFLGFLESGKTKFIQETLEDPRMENGQRAKGIVAGEDNKWIHFDYIPGEIDVRDGGAAYTGRLCVIGSKIDEEELAELFGV